MIQHITELDVFRVLLQNAPHYFLEIEQWIGSRIRVETK